MTQSQSQLSESSINDLWNGNVSEETKSEFERISEITDAGGATICQGCGRKSIGIECPYCCGEC